MTAAPAGVAAFDFDGTLVRGDSLPRFLARLLGRHRFSLALARSAPGMLLAYVKGGRDRSKAALLAHAVSGIPLTRAESVGEAFAEVLAGRIRHQMEDAIRWHRDQGHQLILVSASLALYLEPFGRRRGFDRVIATRLEVGEDGRLTGRMVGANVRAEQKAIRLAQEIGTDPVEVWAYGDSAGDREMLAMADHPQWAGARWARKLIHRANPRPTAHRPEWVDGC